MRWLVLLAIGSVACEDTGLDPFRILEVEPSRWELDSPPRTPLSVTGTGFHSVPVTHLWSDPTVRVLTAFSGTLGGLEIDLELVEDGTLECEAPDELGPGRHDLVIVGPDGRSDRLPEAVRVGAGLDLAELVVNSGADDTDILEPNPTRADAGDELTLREAIRIANAASEPYAIRFESDVIVTVDTSLGELPAITREGTVVDGGGYDVVLNGVGTTDFVGLTVEANFVQIVGIRVESFDGSGGYAIVVRGDDFQLRHCSFYQCSREDIGQGAQVSFESGTRGLVQYCLFENGRRDGVRFQAGASNAVVEKSAFVGNGDDGVNLLGPGHVVRDNTIEDSGGSGIECVNENASDIVIERNIISGSGVSERPGFDPIVEGAGVVVKWNARDVTIRDTIFEANRMDGVVVDEGVGVTVSRGTFRRMPMGGLAIRVPGIPTPAEPTFDGLVATGVAPGNAIVEIYTVQSAADATFFTEKEGAWSITLPEFVPNIGVTQTIDGSTSAMVVKSYEE